jgi:hypothetical protein
MPFEKDKEPLGLSFFFLFRHSLKQIAFDWFGLESLSCDRVYRFRRRSRCGVQRERASRYRDIIRSKQSRGITVADIADKLFRVRTGKFKENVGYALFSIRCRSRVGEL